jgi:pentatricopeptide repeat protein
VLPSAHHRGAQFDDGALPSQATTTLRNNMMQQSGWAVRKTLLKRANPSYLSSFSSLQGGATQYSGCAITTKLSIPYSSPPTLFPRISYSLFSRQEFFSSTSTANSPEGIIDALLGPNTAPVGSLTPKDWKDAQEAISYLTEQKTKQSIEKAWEILDRLVVEAKQGSNSAISQEEFTGMLNEVVQALKVSVVIKVYRVKRSDVMQESNAVLLRLDRYAPYLLPSASTYNAIIYIVNRRTYYDHSRHLQIAATQFAESVLERMHKEAEENPLVKPDVMTYNLVMRAWANSKLPGFLKKTEATFRQMEADGLSPDASAFNAVISAHVYQKDALAMRRAEVILAHMQKLHEEGIKMVKPDAHTFNTIISGYAHRADPKNAEATLYRMQEYYEAGNADAKPDSHSFRQVIISWAKRKDALGAQRAEDILQHMLRQYDEGVSDVKPNLQCYIEVINAWAKVGEQSSIRKAEEILRLLMKRSSERPGDNDCRPNAQCFHPLIAAWSKSGDSSGGKKVDLYLQQMKGAGIEITKDVYEAALKAWKKSDNLEMKKQRIAVLEQEIERLKVIRDGATDNNCLNST